MKNKRGFAHLEIIVVLALIAVVGVVVFWVSRNGGVPVVTQSSPSPEAMMEEDMGGWVTYQSGAYSFKYPNTLKLEESGEWTTFLIEETPLNPSTGTAVYLYYKLESSEVDLNTFIDNYPLDFVIKEPISVSKVDGIKAFTEVNIYYFFKNTGSSDVSIFMTEAVTASAQKTINQILSTFEFMGMLGDEFADEIKKSVIEEYPTMNIYTREKIQVEEFGDGLYIASWPPIDDEGRPIDAGGAYVFVKKVDSGWVVADENLKCEWLEDADIEENEKAFYLSTC